MGDRAQPLKTLTGARWLRLGSGIAFALLLGAAFPFRAGDLRFDVGWIAAWLTLVPFAWLVRGLRPRSAFFWGTGAATLGYGIALFWIYVVVAIHGHAPAAIAVLGTLLLSLYAGLHAGAAAAAVVFLAPQAGRLAVLVLPSAWVVAEHLRSFDLWGGFPWAFLGYAAHGDGPVLELASIGGVFGLSFLYASSASLLVRRRWVAAISVIVLAHAVGFGLRIGRVGQLEEGPPVAVGLVQANIPQDQKWQRDRAREAFDAHLDLSRWAALAGRVDLIIWPEASVPVVLEWEPEYRDAIAKLARDTNAVVILGAMSVEPVSEAVTPGGRIEDWRFYNSVLIVTPEGGFVDRYDKSHLVPFGEYVPMRNFLGWLGAVATGLAVGDVTAGPGPRSIVLAELGEDHALAPLICYEVIYPALVRDAVQRGARVLLNVTNDAWYGRTSAPHQFMAIAAMRSAEHGVPMLRAANTGVSAVVDAGGAVMHETPIFERHGLRARVPEPRGTATLYTRFGDWIVWASWGLLIAFLIRTGGRAIARRRRVDADAG